MRVSLLVPALATAGTDVAYVALVRGQEGGEVTGRVVFFAAYLAALAVLLLAAAFASRENAVRSTIAAMAGLVAAGGLALASIGMVFLLLACVTAGLLVRVTVTERPSGTATWGWRVVAGCAPLAVLAAGLLST